MTDNSQPPFPQATPRLSTLMVAVLVMALAVSLGMATTLIVSNTNASGAGSLQQALLDANATNGLDTIVFQIPGTGVRTISPTNALPTITDPAVVDGTTQPGFAGTPLIELNGSSAGTSSDGLRLSAGNSTIRGLIINRFYGAGISLQAPGGTNTIQGNYIGTDWTGTTNRGNGQATTRMGGVLIQGSSGNFIGGLHSTNRNLISANGGSGLYLQNCSGNTIQGNLFGTSVSATAALGNTTNGVTLYNANGNLIGGTSTAARNIISGNAWSGVYLQGSSSTGNRIEGNYIGTDTNGSLAIPNGGDGVTINGAPANTIGGTDAGAGNLLSGNSQGGVNLKNAGADSNVIQGNLIGTDWSGRLACGNLFSGITILGGHSNLIGGTSAAARNIISGNKLAGVYLTTNSAGNLVQGNYIGLSVTGTNALGNLKNGIAIESASANTIGGTVAEARNVISGNSSNGIAIYGSPATGNAILGNYIGSDFRGLVALSNRLCGIQIQSSANTIGGAATGAGNLLSGNVLDGIFLDGTNATSNVIQGNWIGTAADGKTGLMNVRAGVGIAMASGNFIGGTAPGAGNLISANANSAGDAGIYLFANANGNTIQGNKIGTDSTGTLALGNTHEGIYIESAHSNTIGGVIPGAGNLISGNKMYGIFLTNKASWNVIQGNWIGTASDGVSVLGNRYHSVDCDGGASNNTIGGTDNAGNTIAFTQVYTGVRIYDGSTNNTILGNSIFSNNTLGIDLGDSAGTNAIIACGNATGANMAQNYPRLTQAVSGSGTGIRGTLNSKPNRTYLLQFFASPTRDPSGCGEGQFYLGQMTVSTDNKCTNSFVANLSTPIPPGYSFITATATDSANNTSEFSASVIVAAVPNLTLTSLSASNQVRLAWTNTPAGFVLKQTDNLSPPVEWTTVTNTPIATNNLFVVPLSITTSNQYFRLSFE